LLVELPDQVAALDAALRGILPAFGIRLGCVAQIDLTVRALGQSPQFGSTLFRHGGDVGGGPSYVGHGAFGLPLVNG
jgi:hypothetical protein